MHRLEKYLYIEFRETEEDVKSDGSSKIVKIGNQNYKISSGGICTKKFENAYKNRLEKIGRVLIKNKNILSEKGLGKKILKISIGLESYD